MIGLVDFTKLEPGMAHETYDFLRPHRPNFSFKVNVMYTGTK